MRFRGCGTALVTPFKKDLSLDEEAMRRLVRRQIEQGIDFLVPMGTTGESPTVTHQEHLRVVELTLEEAKGKVPVLAGAGGYNTAEVIHLAKELKTMGVDGILSVTPYYNKPTQEGVYQHFKAIVFGNAKSAELADDVVHDLQIAGRRRHRAARPIDAAAGPAAGSLAKPGPLSRAGAGAGQLPGFDRPGGWFHDRGFCFYRIGQNNSCRS